MHPIDLEIRKTLEVVEKKADLSEQCSKCNVNDLREKKKFIKIPTPRHLMRSRQEEMGVSR